jgi:hypothetical protein
MLYNIRLIISEISFLLFYFDRCIKLNSSWIFLFLSSFFLLRLLSFLIRPLVDNEWSSVRVCNQRCIFLWNITSLWGYKNILHAQLNRFTLVKNSSIRVMLDILNSCISLYISIFHCNARIEGYTHTLSLSLSLSLSLWIRRAYQIRIRFVSNLLPATCLENTKKHGIGREFACTFAANALTTKIEGDLRSINVQFPYNTFSRMKSLFSLSLSHLLIYLWKFHKIKLPLGNVCNFGTINHICVSTWILLHVRSITVYALRQNLSVTIICHQCGKRYVRWLPSYEI